MLEGVLLTTSSWYLGFFIHLMIGVCRLVLVADCICFAKYGHHIFDSFVIESFQAGFEVTRKTTATSWATLFELMISGSAIILFEWLFRFVLQKKIIEVFFLQKKDAFRLIAMFGILFVSGLVIYNSGIRQFYSVNGHFESKDQLDSVLGRSQKKMIDPWSVEKKPDILIAAIESWRYDAIAFDLSPLLNQQADALGCQISEKHYSGSHLSHQSIFTLLYGLDIQHKKSRKQFSNIAFEQLKRNGYRLVAAGSPLKSKTKKYKYVYEDFSPFKEFPTKSIYQGDQEAALWLDDDRYLHAQPTFQFYYGYSTHHNY